jgi:hypothetical protein
MYTRRWTSSAAWLLAVSALAGTACYDNDESRAQDRTRPTTSEVQRDVEQSWDQLRGYAVEKRADFEQAMNARLSRMERDIDDLQGKLGAKRDEFEPELEGFRAKLRDMRSELNELRVAAAEQWEETRNNIVDSGRELGDSLEDLRDRLRT